MAGHNLIVKERIAEGGFGFVDLVQNPTTGQEFVLKRCGIQRQEIFELVNKEITLLRRFKDKHIVHLIASETSQNSGKREAYLLLEYCSGGHLLAKLNGRNGISLPLSDICRIFTQLLEAVAPLHASSPPVIHRDLKLENILFSEEGFVKLCDFGSCALGYTSLRSAEERSRAEESISKETTQMYRAPEMVDLYMRDELTEKTDIWALGCILYCLCFISHPFQDAGNLGILSAKLNFPRTFAIPEEMNTLISRLLDLDPEARPTILEINSAIRAISQGNPLPPYELSEVAQQRKEERRLAQLKRSNQTQKKSAALPTRGHVPLAADSVAARRLAAKRNGSSAPGTSGIGSIPHPGYGTPAASSSSNFFEEEEQPIPVASQQIANDLDFFATPAASTATASSSSTFFDAFSSPPAATTAKPVAAPAIDLFGSQDLFAIPTPAPQPAQSQQTTFDAFGGSSSLLTDMSFTTAPPPTIEEKAKNVLNLFDVPQQNKPPVAQDPYAALMNPGYNQARPMGPPSSGLGYGAPPMYGMPQPGIPTMMPTMVRQQQPPKQAERDPFGSLGGFDAMKRK